MPPKARARGQRPQPPPQPSDYETDAANATDYAPPQDRPRTNEELNFSVVRKHYPEVTAIPHLASYAVIYTFNLATNVWEKKGIQGTLFVCQLTPSAIGAERFAIVILNRAGLENFYCELPEEEEMEITEEYIIVKGPSEAIAEVDGEAEAELGTEVYGVWVYARPGESSATARDDTVQVLLALAKRAKESREEKEREMAVHNGNGNGVQDQVMEQAEQSVPMGRQLSIRELFGEQREQDAAWSVHNHGVPPQQAPGLGHVLGQGQAPTSQAPASRPDLLAQLFMKARQDYNGPG